jgi:hypothetical protein
VGGAGKKKPSQEIASRLNLSLPGPSGSGCLPLLPACLPACLLPILSGCSESSQGTQIERMNFVEDPLGHRICVPTVLKISEPFHQV